MRRIILALGASAAIIISFVMANAAAAAPVVTAHGFSLNGSVAGGVTSAESGQPLTFVFTEKNVGTTAQSEDLVLEFDHERQRGVGWLCASGGRSDQPRRTGL